MLGIEQTLRILKHAFEADPQHFDIRTWAEQAPLLTDVMDDLFIADEKYVIQQDVLPQAVGQTIASPTYANFGQGEVQNSRADSLLIGPTRTTLSRQYLSYIMLRLDKPGGWLIGGSYRTNTLTRMFAAASLGQQGMAALMNTQAKRIQAIAGLAATAEPGTDIASTAMYSAMQARPDGTWTGPSAIDNVDRIHAFRRVPGRDFTVVVAIGEADAMRPANVWANGARYLAIGGTLALLLVAWVALYVIWTFRATHRRRQALERERTMVATVQQELTDIRSRIDSKTAQLHAVLAGISDGVLIVDKDLRLSEWGPRSATLCGIARDVLQPELPLDELLRAPARAGSFGAIEDIETEVARRIALLLASDGNQTIHTSTDGRSLAMRSRKLPDGSSILLIAESVEQATSAREAEQSGVSRSVETL